MNHSNKHIITLLFLLLVFSGCGVGKMLSKNSMRNREQRKVEVASRVNKNESLFSGRGIVFSDSSNHEYRVMIFPLDSFSYSVQDGFRGQAQRIEISGSADHISKGGFYEKELKIRSSDSNTIHSEESRTVNRSVSKELTKRSSHGFILSVIAIVVLIAWRWWKLRYQHG